MTLPTGAGDFRRRRKLPSLARREPARNPLPNEFAAVAAKQPTQGLWLGEAEEGHYASVRGTLHHNTVAQHSGYVEAHVAQQVPIAAVAMP